MVMFPKFQDALVALPTVVALDALLSGGVESVPGPVYDALRSDDMKRALRAGEEWVEKAGEQELAPRIAQPLLLEGCDRLDDAVEAIDRARKRAGDVAALDVVEAEIRLERGEFDRSEQLLEGFCESRRGDDSVDAAVWGFVGDLFLDLGREEEAVTCYERAIERGTERFETAIRLAKLCEDRESWEQAAETFERAAELGGDVVGPWDEAAECWRRAGELRRSLEARSEVLEQRTGDAETWAKQGVGYRHLGELERAAEALEKATRFAPERPEYWIERAEVLQKMGRLERAIECYREVLAFDPDYLAARIGIASAALNQGDPSRAGEAARRAIETDESAAEAHVVLGRALRARNATEEAVDALRRAVELAPEDPESHRELGELLVEFGSTEAGLDHLERAVDLGAGEGRRAPVLAQTLLRETEYDRLRELARSESAEESGRVWQLVGPVYRTVVAGVEEDRDEVQRACEAFRKAVEVHEERIPVDYEFDELERFGVVLDRAFSEPLESMIGILEGRDALDDLSG